ncbi:ribosomal subunit interface protein [Rhodopseudomonas julia]|uniref:Ribosome hibernation promoting factor n=1 Tax=Rhodopseudomonas julia TaxID=200617 RepID=A0ABU0C4R0_9BRAD|nr:ribosome-associated translation inhibitor RaiA [Rhodopseudomonas julia]MDQ0325500.1 ribosomal subunit interface protein [Rhodopseudomonas julia]
MALKISGKNVDIGEALRSRIEETVEAAVKKYFDGGYAGHVVVAKNGRNFHTDCSLHLDSGAVFEASSTSADANDGFDAAAERLEKRLRRYKRRIKDHKGKPSHKLAGAAANAFIIEPPDEEEEIGEEYAPAIVAETTTEIRRMTVSSAVLQLDMTDAPVVVFRNHSHGGLNVVYRRPDGHFGWIDPVLNEPSEPNNGGS